MLPAYTTTGKSAKDHLVNIHIDQLPEARNYRGKVILE
jgi:hypothetical protein